MNFDLRIPVGMMFTIFGLILAGVGLFGQPDLGKSLGINIDLNWGVVLVVFGLFMLFMAGRGSAKKP
jgi:hypothetical protein